MCKKNIQIMTEPVEYIANTLFRFGGLAPKAWAAMPRMTAATKAKEAVARIAAKVPVAVTARSELHD